MMLRRLWIVLLIVGVSWLNAGCETLGPSDPSSVILKESQAGNTAELIIDETLQIVLEGNPTTGYTWDVTALDTAILVQRGEPEFKPDSNAVGSGGTFTFTFQAVNIGQTTLTLIYHRPWEQDVPPLKTFEVAVIVKQ
jgi:inhibitor of cysteine peptidase